MTDPRIRGASAAAHHSPKMESELSPRRTMVVLVIVVGCFAVLWPKVFYPMLVGSANEHIKPSAIDKTTGCCDVISETDVNTIKIMTELCGSIINATGDRLGGEVVQKCKREILETCGIDVSAVLQEQVRLGQNVKQILDEIRSLNGSLCLKYNYGVAPWRLGVPHRVTVKMASQAPNIRQERPMHLRSELIHPAFRERGRAIPQPQAAPPARPPPRVVEGRPGPLPGMRPTIGGAGHVVPPPKQGTSSMSVIMPIYTIGIVIFFTYTLMKIIFKKQPEGVGAALYPPVTPDPHFRKEVFESGARYSRESISSKLVVNAMSALLDEVDQEIEARRKSSEVAAQDLVNGGLSNGDAVKPQDEVQPTVKVLGMEMTASCEGGKKWSRPGSPVLPTPSPPPPPEPAPPPQEIYLEGALPAQSQLLVADSATEPVSGEDPAVVLSGKMTLSVISPDSENGAEETTPNEEIIDKNINDITNLNEETDKEIEEQILQYENHEPEMGLEKDIQDFLHNLQQQNDVQTPSITLESDDLKESLEVEKLEKEVDELIQEAIEKIQEKAVETKENHDEIKDNGVNTEETEETGCQIPPTKPKDDESASDDEIVEEIVYEEESEDEEIEVEVEESDDEEMLNDRNFNRTDSSSARRVNGERSEDLVEESKYTTVSGATAAENDISDEELTDDEEVEEEEIEIEDEEYVNEENVNHVAGDSDSEA